MEKTNYYYLKEIVIGLRKEYLENQKKITGLKQYLKASNFSLKDIDINYTSIDDTFCSIINSDQGYNRKNLCCDIKKENDGNFSIVSYNGETIKIIEDLRYLFTKNANQIIDSPFTKGIVLQHVIVSEPNLNLSKQPVQCYFTNNHNSFWLGTTSYDDLPFGVYYSYNDQFNIHGINKKNPVMSLEMFLKMLDTKFKKDDFNSYQQELIEVNGVGKTFSIASGTIINDDKETLKFKDKGKSLILTNKWN